MTPYHFCYVYVLQSIRFAREIYIGLTRDLRKRIVDHNEGGTTSTRRYAPWKIVYYEAFSSYPVAREREFQLKNNGNAMRELKRKIGLLSVGKSGKGFTLVETLVAITLLTVAIIAPMSLATKSLSAAYYARDQVIASNLAQEAIEAVRNRRDGNILRTVQGNTVDLLDGITTDGSPFAIDTRNNKIYECECLGGCPALRTEDPEGEFYAYGDPGAAISCTAPSGWKSTKFIRSVSAEPVEYNPDEVLITSSVAWQTGVFQRRTISLTETLYRWVGESLGGGGDGGGGGANPISCQTILDSGGGNISGVYTIDPDGNGGAAPFSVYCDMTTNGGGWTLIVKGDRDQIESSNPPNFDTCSSFWTSDGASYGDPSSSVHFSKAWSHTPPFTEFMWEEESSDYFESGLTYQGNLKDWVKSSGTIKLNNGITGGVGGGGRIYRTTYEAICNYGDGSSPWGIGFAPVRRCSSGSIYSSNSCLLGTITYEMWAPTTPGYHALWVR